MDEDAFELLTRKGVYPYEYMYSWEKMEQASLPNKEYYFSRNQSSKNTMHSAIIRIGHHVIFSENNEIDLLFDFRNETNSKEI